MWRAMTSLKRSGNNILAAQHPPEGPLRQRGARRSKDKGTGDEGTGDEDKDRSVLYTVRSPHPGTPSVYYRIGSWEDVEAAKAAEANAEASKAANPNDASNLDLEIIREHEDVGKKETDGCISP